jgi:hypothetical protein
MRTVRAQDIHTGDVIVEPHGDLYRVHVRGRIRDGVVPLKSYRTFGERTGNTTYPGVQEHNIEPPLNSEIQIA